ncbi:MAG: ribosome assembly RNA-binding protein YhbY [Firmicutes bacterium]|nr:ribosome assembly RNA-binding protein YhbY [Bacillota bacterium]
MLTGKQKRLLRAFATSLDPLFQIGKGGVSENLVHQVEEALKARELIKLRVLSQSPEDVREVARSLKEKTGAEIVQIIGHNLVLYRQGEKGVIQLP